MTRTELGAQRSRLAASIAAASPRVLVISAPPGYDKTALLDAYAERAGLSRTTCDLTGEGNAPDIARRVVDALVSRDRSRAARSVADRLAQPRELIPATSREMLRREWPCSEEHELFVLRDNAGALFSPSGVELLSELIATVPAARTIAISTRTTLPPALQQIVARESLVTVGVADLALDREGVKEVVRHAGAPAGTSCAIYELAQGWPLVSRLLADLSRRDGSALEAAAILPHESLLAFAAHRTILAMDTLLREAVVVAVLLGGASQAELSDVLGDACDDVLFARLSRIPFVAGAERADVHSEVATLLRTRFEPLVKMVYERTLHALIGHASHARAANVALEFGEANRAAMILDEAPSYTVAHVTLSEYERVLDRIDRGLLTRYPNVWLATIPYRAFSRDRATYVREAETVYYCLPRTAESGQRAVVLMHLCSAYANIGRLAECDQLLADALAGFASENGAARATLLYLASDLRGIEGRFSLARALAQEAAAISGEPFEWDENQTLHYIDAHEAAFRGRFDRVIVIFDELLRRRAREELPLYLAYGATNGAIFAWIAGEDEAFERYLSILQEALTPGLELGFAPMIDAARGRPALVDNRYGWPVISAIMHLYRLGASTEQAEAVDAARAAARAADEGFDPYAQILAHAAIYILDETCREREAKLLRQIVAPVESPEMHAAVHGILSGGFAGMLEPFVRRRVLRERRRAEPRFVVELLHGRVTRDGTALRLSDKELELVALLASTHGAVSRDRIGEALWDHLDPEEWPNNLKVTLSRLRAKLGDRDVVQSADGAYRLSPTIDVDLRRAESVVRASAGGPLSEEMRAALRAILASYREGSSSRYERYAWMQPGLARINDIVSTAGLALANDALRRQAYDDALADAAAVAEIDSFNEGACEATIRAFLARGEVDAARREFRRHAKALADELGAAPSQRLAELVRAS